MHNIVVLIWIAQHSKEVWETVTNKKTALTFLTCQLKLYQKCYLETQMSISPLAAVS